MRFNEPNKNLFSIFYKCSWQRLSYCLLKAKKFCPFIILPSFISHLQFNHFFV